MKRNKKFPFFQVAALAIFFAFMGTMFFVTITAYGRRSGQTGLDMGKVQKMRYQSNLS